MILLFGEFALQVLRGHDTLGCFSDSSVQCTTFAGLWNYQILLLEHRQVSGHNPLVQPRFFCQKLIFFIFLETCVVVTH